LKKIKKMKKKISLNKLQLRKEKVSNLSNLKGGDSHNTFDVYCANNTLYPACAVTGCWGAQSCMITDKCGQTTD
jgi:hypothetical protein